MVARTTGLTEPRDHVAQILGNAAVRETSRGVVVATRL